MEENKEHLLPDGFEWCRKGLYEVQIELACYLIDDDHPLKEGFIPDEINGVMYAVKEGVNILEKNQWKARPERPYVITGTVGERWPVKSENLAAYDVDPSDIGTEPVTVSTKDPSDQDFMVAFHIPEGEEAQVIPKWAFKKDDDGKYDGTIDETQIMYANLEDTIVSHNGGDYVVAKHIEGKPEYWELSPEERNTPEMAILYDPRIINGSVMETTYDHALTKEEIFSKYDQRRKK